MSIKIRKKIGIIGHRENKFNSITKKSAISLIKTLLNNDIILVSGGCHLGGIDIWSEKIADEMNIQKIIHYPKRLQWSGGYRERNIKVAKDSDVIYIIVVEKYPENYIGERFNYCYHCKKTNHVKSGACWTGKKSNRNI